MLSFSTTGLVSTAGDGVGETVGNAVGESVGALEGVAVGVGEGEAVGFTVGVEEGEAVGTSDGTGVGVSVGEAVGLAVGVALGEVVGISVGLSCSTKATGRKASKAVHACMCMYVHTRFMYMRVHATKTIYAYSVRDIHTPPYPSSSLTSNHIFPSFPAAWKFLPWVRRSGTPSERM
jgi:hypothetical protein